MCYSAQEAGYLAEQGFDDFLVGYPTCQAHDVAAVHRVTQSEKKVTLIVDCPQQVERLADEWRDLGSEYPLRVCVEADISWRPCGMHIGAQRSPLRSLDAVGRVLDCIARRPELRLTGMMTYEAHLAGLSDYKPGSPLRNFAVGAMKAWARGNVARQRRKLAEYMHRRGITLELINGGGTGSFQHALRDPWLGEVTVGSGLLQPHLFDGYQEALGEPALLFALPVTRSSQSDRVTCHSGGFIASGTPGSDRWPSPFLPPGLRVDPREGCGEVQTPLIVPRAWQGGLNIGDPVFFRPAKAGEIAEHFGEYLLLQGGRIVDRMKTYRGMGFCFH
jgi:D-serine deaminase-like pyridoxal phosphate-dependent protein